MTKRWISCRTVTPKVERVGTAVAKFFFELHNKDPETRKRMPSAVNVLLFGKQLVICSSSGRGAGFLRYLGLELKFHLLDVEEVGLFSKILIGINS